MKSAAARTLDLFPDMPVLTKAPKMPSAKKLRKRLVELALEWHRGHCSYLDVLDAAKALDERLAE